MRLLRRDHLLLTDPAHILALLKDLAQSEFVIETDAAEVQGGTGIVVKAVKDTYFLVETQYPPNEAHAVPLSSWRLTVNLESSKLCMTTVSLARIDTNVFALMVPDEVVSGAGRRHYRVIMGGKESFQVALQNGGMSESADVLDASFSGLQAKLSKGGNCPYDQGSEVVIAGRHRGVLFKEEAVVMWRRDESLGIELIEREGLAPVEERPWAHVVRRMAYDQFMSNLRPAA
ncbi:MAG: hypothetical protein JNM34_03675 [Chthonomonadaceae bacterium]|nr:hypothetical protein [Chthonomonadaceae bacterium]